MSKGERLRWISKLVLGRVESSPFEDSIRDLRRRMDERLISLGLDPSSRESDRKTPINFRRVKAWAEAVEDEDYRFLEGLLSRGVPLGVRGEIPWVSRVYDKKVKDEKEELAWGWDEMEPKVELRSNYGSALAHMDKVQAVVEAEVEKGWIKKISLAEAEKMFGKDLQLASLGAVPKDPNWEEVRVVHDGTHGIAVNTEIKQPNKMTFPQFDDVEAVLRALRSEEPTQRMLIAFDIKAAQPMKEPRRAPKVAGEVFRIDAAAEQEGITIGGWEVFGGKAPKEARWFAVKLTRKTCPWLYLKGEPFRTIAAAELLAVTVAVMTFKKEAQWRDSEGRFSISGCTDNSSNTFVVDKFLSTKFPVSLVLMELAYQMSQLNATLSLSWIPREQNEEADDLTKDRFEKFSPEKRMQVDLEKIGFSVIPELAEVAGRLDEDIRLKKVSKEKKDHGHRTPAEQKLRMTQPW